MHVQYESQRVQQITGGAHNSGLTNPKGKIKKVLEVATDGGCFVDIDDTRRHNTCN